MVRTKLRLNSHKMTRKFNLLNFCGSQTKGDILCEMRFHVPNNELDKYYEEKAKSKEESKGKKTGDASEDEDDDD